MVSQIISRILMVSDNIEFRAHRSGGRRLPSTGDGTGVAMESAGVALLKRDIIGIDLSPGSILSAGTMASSRSAIGHESILSGDRRTITDPVRVAGRTPAKRRPMPASAGGFASQCFGPSCVSRGARKGHGRVIIWPKSPSLAGR
ncbi:hypothetical protein [Bradyrhizobium sp. SSUT77]|uniref:hypothetical protein n=1 Tax=Bradyrhizobium sp. SSUT77 TaxID=3040603 RepID=UPI00244CEB56|nr:hypothetical protein [Bradyrhizobium sp. SSUT77]MDH2348206.1 hypothetical protein [Bradyrhizobium sp. SSUT77]